MEVKVEAAYPPEIFYRLTVTNPTNRILGIVANHYRQMYEDKNNRQNIEKQTIVKGQRIKILTRQESRHSSRPDVFYFFATAHF